MSVSPARLSSWRFAVGLVSPHGRSLALVLGAMAVQTLARLASPWPLKVVLDSVLGSEPLPVWLAGWLPLSAPITITS